ncbi:MAG: helix-turn-helix domain-containing protein [Deltaproteobacteria bacterium]|nr:helix-turn-helix domain-containing protein [Deltaproteobacteria bacterium]
MVPIQHLGRALVVLREKNGRTQEEVAGLAGITASMISNYERGKEKPSLESLWKMLSAMNCSLIDLEAALRFARGDVFPFHCQNWRIRIEQDEYDLSVGGSMPGEIAEPSFDLSSILSDQDSISSDAERYLLGMLRMMVGLLRHSEARDA